MNPQAQFLAMLLGNVINVLSTITKLSDLLLFTCFIVVSYFYTENRQFFVSFIINLIQCFFNLLLKFSLSWNILAKFSTPELAGSQPLPAITADEELS